MAVTNDAQTSSDRDETPDERLDRLWTDLLQELRVMQTGAQLAAGFLLTLPFNDRFADLDHLQVGLYLVLVLLAGLTTALVMTPVAVHRRLAGKHVKERLVATAHVLTKAVLASISLLILGMTVFIFDVVTDRGLALGVGAAMAAVLVLLMVLLPLRLVSRADD